jgi:two-component sensor histidine kinase
MKIVMVGDSAADHELCRGLLEQKLGPRLELWEAAAPQTGLETCRAVMPDCILPGERLQGMTGVEFLARLHSDLFDEPTPAVVMLGDLADPQAAVDAMKAGAQDYLVAHRLTPERLLAAIEQARERAAMLRTFKQERDRLARSLAEKEVLLKEVHHRVKNNLAVIASLLQLQASSRSDNDALGEALRESQSRVESMALIHELLFDNDAGEVDLAKHASLLLTRLLHAYGVDPARVSGYVKLEPLPLRMDRAIPAALILNELISNALKHAFPGGRSGSIRIEGGRTADGLVTLEVHDDGDGIPEGREPQRPGSLGMEIVRILTRQLKGAFDLDRAGGTTFRLSFPED